MPSTGLVGVSVARVLVAMLALVLLGVVVLPAGKSRAAGGTPAIAARPGCGELYAADTFSRTVPLNHSWGVPDVGLAPWEVSFGGSRLDLWWVDHGVGKARTTNMASSGQRVPAGRDVDVQARFATSALPSDGSVSTGFFARFRRSGGPEGDHVRMRVRIKDGRLRISVSRVVGGVTISTEERDAGRASARAWFWMRLRVVDDSVLGKVWRNRTTEPRWLTKMRHPAVAAMPQTDVGIRTTYVTGPVFPLLLYDDFSVCAPMNASSATG